MTTAGTTAAPPWQEWELSEDEAFALAVHLLRRGDLKDTAVQQLLAHCERKDAFAHAKALPPGSPAPRLRIPREQLEAYEPSLRQWTAAEKDFFRAGNGAGNAGKIVADNQANVALALVRLGVVLSHDLFSQRLLLGPAPLDDAAVEGLWLRVDEQFGFRPQFLFFEKVVKDIARRRPFHPVRHYLDGLEWDSTPRLDAWLVTYGGAADTPLTRKVGALPLIAAVRRVRPASAKFGCKFDELLILESDQGLEKSSALRALCPSEEWFSDDLPLGVDSKQMIERTGGKWIIEAAECLNLGKRETDQLKGSLSRQVDGPVRLAYGRMAVEVARQFVVIGTTNKQVYLKDATGNRRFWAVRVKRFDVAALKRDRDQLWAEAAAREAAGESIRLPEGLYSAAGDEQERRRAEDPWEAILAAGLTRGKVDADKMPLSGPWAVLDIPTERRDTAGQDRIAAIMQRLGFEKKNIRFTPQDAKAWGCPEVCKGWSRRSRLLWKTQRQVSTDTGDGDE